MVIIYHLHMKLLFDVDVLSNSSKLLPIECEYCKNTFYIQAKEIRREKKRNTNNLRFCGRKCYGLYQQNRIKTICVNCKKEVLKIPAQIKKSKSGNSFCSRSCSAIYNNTHKKTGIRRSKLETWIEQKLNIDYPNVLVEYNKKDIINSELDIYFPELKLAVELNGIFHYEPIYGNTKFKKIINNDNRKFQACLENNIELIIIDVSYMQHFNINDAKLYYKIITNILLEKIKYADSSGIDPHTLSDITCFPNKAESHSCILSK